MGKVKAKIVPFNIFKDIYNKTYWLSKPVLRLLDFTFQILVYKKFM